jgi:hypothetical protein
MWEPGYWSYEYPLVNLDRIVLQALGNDRLDMCGPLVRRCEGKERIDVYSKRCWVAFWFIVFNIITPH